jgi:DNA-directed RNA polymerase specialized sigma24 family protein
VPLALAYYGDQDYDEIAAALGITRNHVGVLLCRAKQMLRQSLTVNVTTDAGRDARHNPIPEGTA